MTNTYFPYYDGTGEKTSSFSFNMLPAYAASLDPRDIITEWSEASLKTILKSEVYEGMKLYCIEDRNIRICRWVPSGTLTSTYTGNDCIWDILHGGDNENTWIDVTTYSHANTIEELIEEKNKTLWQYSYSKNGSYYGFYKFTSINELNDILNKIVINSDATNLNYIAQFASAAATKSGKTVTIDTLSYKDSETAIENDKDCNFMVITPVSKSVQSIIVNGEDIKDSCTTCITDIKGISYTIYVSNNIYDEDAIIALVNTDKAILIAY